MRKIQVMINIDIKPENKDRISELAKELLCMKAIDKTNYQIVQGMSAIWDMGKK